MRAPRDTLRTAADLHAAGLLPSERQAAIAKVAETYAVGLTSALAALIDPSDPDDPIARQFIPSERELDADPVERIDPIGDDAFSPVEGLVHRYPDRVLLKLVHHCPVYCRFCFRRETVGPNGVPPLGAEALAAALAYIAAHPGIWEVILTGGDPLMLSPARLGEIATELGKIAHIKILRLHSRVPVADPSRVTEAMIAALRGCGKAVYLVLHANHPRELTAAARAACARFIDAGIPVLSQSVLLRGVNDDSLVLENLMRSFVEMRVLPYYLHHPDLARGTAHLRVSIAEGQALISALRGRLSGLCQPRYVLDIPGGHGKVPIGPAYVVQSGDAYRITDYRGNAHVYPPAIGRSDEGEAP